VHCSCIVFQQNLEACKWVIDRATWGAISADLQQSASECFDSNIDVCDVTVVGAHPAFRCLLIGRGQAMSLVGETSACQTCGAACQGASPQPTTGWLLRPRCCGASRNNTGVPAHWEHLSSSCAWCIHVLFLKCFAKLGVSFLTRRVCRGVSVWPPWQTAAFVKFATTVASSQLSSHITVAICLPCHV